MENTKQERAPIDFTSVERAERRFSIYLRDSQYFKIEEISKKLGITKAKVLRKLVEDGLRHVKY